MLQEYMALKRYISEKQLPARFQVVGGVGSWERPPPAPAPAPPRARHQLPGARPVPPSRHTAAATYHGRDTRFTAKIDRQGMYRNHSVNL